MTEQVTFVVMVGIAGAGKSTHARRLAKVYNATVLESDAYRVQMFGDIRVIDRNAELFAKMQVDMIELLSKGVSVIYDATSLTLKRRVALLEQVKRFGNLYKMCVVVATPIEDCFVQNNFRPVQVPEWAIAEQRSAFQMPLYEEGWDTIDIYYGEHDLSKYTEANFLAIADTFDQENYHHSLTLGAHSAKVRELVFRETYSESMCLAASLHDNGKLETKVMKNMKGEPSDIAHYYGHENVGAYNAMFYMKNEGLNIRSTVFACGLITYHMRPYMANTEKAKEKLLKTVGRDMYHFLMILHEADVKAH